jgi:hypothetical protein
MRILPQRLDGFRVLSEYECGRAQMAIEWVARAQKPIVEIGGCQIKGCDILALAHDLSRCIARSGESVRAFVMPDGIMGYCCYGFYRCPWAINAMLRIWSGHTPTGRYDSLWLRGLLFGYSRDAIQAFMSSASCVPESNLPRFPCSRCVRLRRVEIYGSLARLVRRHSNRTCRCRKRN